MDDKALSELGTNHYRAVRENPLYVMEGMMDVLREELAMNTPTCDLPEIREVTQEPWERKQWYIVNQLRGEMANLKRKLIGGTKGQDRL